VRSAEVVNTHSSRALLPYEVVGRILASGAPVEGAMVTLRHTSTGSVERCQTDERGRYTFFVHDSGPWQLTVEARRLATYTRQGLRLEPRQRIWLDVELRQPRQ
jgi:hypothetical protein